MGALVVRMKRAEIGRQLCQVRGARRAEAEAELGGVRPRRRPREDLATAVDPDGHDREPERVGELHRADLSPRQAARHRALREDVEVVSRSERLAAQLDRAGHHDLIELGDAFAVGRPARRERISDDLAGACAEGGEHRTVGQRRARVDVVAQRAVFLLGGAPPVDVEEVHREDVAARDERQRARHDAEVPHPGGVVVLSLARDDDADAAPVQRPAQEHDLVAVRRVADQQRGLRGDVLEPLVGHGHPAGAHERRRHATKEFDPPGSRQDVVVPHEAPAHHAVPLLHP